VENARRVVSMSLFRLLGYLMAILTDPPTAAKDVGLAGNALSPTQNLKRIPVYDAGSW
jgi:hypothetical protein